MQHTPQSQNNTAPILPSEKSQAVNMLIRVTQNLITLAERESQSLAQNDLMTFAILQDEKTFMADHYARVSSEFRARINQYRGVDKTLLKRLETMQNDLAERTRTNNQVVTTLYDRTRANTQSVLLAAQEMGQNCHIKYPANTNETIEG
jgi:hypothetical protein